MMVCVKNAIIRESDRFLFFEKNFKSRILLRLNKDSVENLNKINPKIKL